MSGRAVDGERCYCAEADHPHTHQGTNVILWGAYDDDWDRKVLAETSDWLSFRDVRPERAVTADRALVSEAELHRLVEPEWREEALHDLMGPSSYSARERDEWQEEGLW